MPLHDHADHAPIREWLTDHPATSTPLPVTALTLVAQQHDRRQITWRVISEIPLTGSTT